MVQTRLVLFEPNKPARSTSYYYFWDSSPTQYFVFTEQAQTLHQPIIIGLDLKISKLVFSLLHETKSDEIIKNFSRFGPRIFGYNPTRFACPNNGEKRGENKRKICCIKNGHVGSWAQFVIRVLWRLGPWHANQHHHLFVKSPFEFRQKVLLSWAPHPTPPPMFYNQT